MDALNIERVHADQSGAEQFQRFQNGGCALAGHRFKGRGLTDAPQTFVGGDLHQHIQRVILYRKSNTEGLFHGDTDGFYLYVCDFHRVPPAQ